MIRLRLLFFLFVSIAFVFGCGDESPSSEKSPRQDLPIQTNDTPELEREVMVASTNSCPSDSCVIGTMGCNTSGDQVPCIQNPKEADGCGYYDYKSSVGCGVDTFCFHGECLSPDNIPLPTASNNPDWQSIFDFGSVAFDVDETIQVIPYEAFINALREEDFNEATDAHLDLASDFVMDANDPNILGLHMDLDDEAGSFSGDVFIVLMDPVLMPGDEVQAMNYFVVAAPGLSGPTSWLGTSPSLIGVGAMGLPSAGCCSGGQPDRSCGFMGGGFGPLPQRPGQCNINASDCPFPWNSELSDLIETDPRKQPFRVGGGVTTKPDITGRVRHTLFRGNGMPAVYMYATMERSVNENAFDPNDDNNLAGLVAGAPIQMAFHNPLVCETCDTALCRQDPPLDPNFAPVTASDACGVPITGTDEVPEHCQQMSPQGPGGLDCGGIFDGMGREFDPADVCGNYRSLAGTSIIGPASGPGASPCTGRTTPHWCTIAYSAGSECDCDAQCEADRHQFMSWFYGCSDGTLGNSPAPGVTCHEDGTVCVDSEGSGRKICYGCDDDGACGATVDSTGPDSRYFASDDEEKEENEYRAAKSASDCTAGEMWGLFEGEGELDQIGCIKVSSKGSATDESATGSGSTGNSQGPQNSTTQQPSGDPADGEQNESEEDYERESVVVSESGASREFIEGIFERSPEKNKNIEQNHPHEQFDVRDIASAPRDGGRSGAADAVGQPNSDKGGGPGSKQAQQPGQKTDGDPVLLATGALVVTQEDMSFPGPVRPLNFTRFYDSTSDDRSILGSNWSHNYDSRVIPIRPGNMPAWAPPYCIAFTPTTTCALVQYPGGGTRLFIKSPGGTDDLFYPQAGSADTLRKDQGGWQLRTPEGHLRVFGRYGYLIKDEDRFGNGYQIAYEPTPTYKLTQRYCHKTSHFARRTALPTDINVISYIDPELDPRVCRALAAMHGDHQEPIVSVHGWQPTFDVSGTTANTLQLPADGPYQDANSDSSLSASFGYSSDARAYVQTLLEGEVNPKLPYGQRKLRPVLVRDSLGRELEFEYHDDPNDLDTYGLLEKVTGPEGSTSTTYSYDRPSNYPERLQESFLVQVDRVDGATPPGVLSSAARSLVFTYNWPGTSAFDSWTGHSPKLWGRYLDYFATFNGCRWGDGLAAVVCSPSTSSGGGTPGIKPTTVCGTNDGEFYGRGGVAAETPGFAAPNCNIGAMADMPESPCYLATREEERYISSVADNLITLTRDGVIELASRYEVNPGKDAFDRVVSQRYGGLDNHEYGPYEQTGSSTHAGWGSVDYPEFSFEYVSTRPKSPDLENPGDVTDQSNISGDLLTRYPLEQNHKPWEPLHACHDDESCGGVPSSPNYDASSCAADYEWSPATMILCNSNAAISRTTKLPGAFQTFDYYELGTQAGDDPNHPKIYRSRLTCRQLASAHMGDARHNGLMKVRSVPDDEWELLSDSRDQIEDDSRRICAWSIVTDRDGHRRQVGMNFRGQPLVEAIEVDGELLVTESLYNADGLIEEQRATTLSQNTWQPADGWVEYVYQEIDPDGENGWNEWIPFWWMKRMNLSSIKVHPDENAQVPTFAHEWDSVAGTFEGEELEWLETSMSYEPLFNQVRQITTTSKIQGQPAKDLHRITYDFDYQEFDGETDDFYDALLSTQAWGWRVPASKRRGDADHLDYLLGWHVPVHFYDADLNGDGVIGFPNYTLENKHRHTRGFPIRMTMENLEADMGDPDWLKRDMMFVSPSPHGLPSRIEDQSGGVKVFEYYPAELHPDGQHPIIEDTYSSKHNIGMLARVLTRRFNQDYSQTEAGVFDSPTNAQVCAELKGPYQWMLPSGCGASADTELANMGIPASVRADLLEAADDGPTAREWSIVSLNYNKLGGVYEVLDDGVKTTFTRDTDGREIHILDALGGETLFERNKRGEITRVELFEDLGGMEPDLASRVHYQRDQEGMVLSVCVDVTEGGCETNLTLTSLLPYATARDTIAPEYLLTTYRYTPEGRLYKVMGPDGVETIMTYDERGLMLSSMTGTAPDERMVRHVYDEHGQVTKTKYGSDATRVAKGALDEDYVHDGLGRVVTVTDVHDVDWQLAWSDTSQIVAYKQDALSYGVASGADNATTAHEVFVDYDGFGRVLRQRAHALALSEVTYDSHGHMRMRETRPASAPAGSGQRQWMTYDATGAPVWSVDQDGNQQFAISNSLARTMSGGTIRVDSRTVGGSPEYLTTTSRLERDLRLNPMIAEQYGHNGEFLQSEYVHGIKGNLLAYHNPENEITTYNHNLVGWVEQVVEPSSVGASASIASSYVYNARGQVLQLTEPGTPGGVTSYAYNDFGERISRTLPMDPMREFDTLVFDGYGRLSNAKFYSSATTHESISWDHVAGPSGVRQVDTYWDNAPTTAKLMRRVEYDALGRVSEMHEHNLALADVMNTPTTRKISTLYQYDALGRTTQEKQQIWDGSSIVSEYEVDSAFLVDAQNRWMKELTYPSGTTWEHSQDTLGRLTKMTQTSVSGGASMGAQVHFDWFGDLYAGREQEYASSQGTPDPLRELRQFDGLGRQSNISYGAVDLDAMSSPVNSSWGDVYCLGNWDTACEAPLVDIALKYDVMGRLVSSRQRFGHAMDDGMGGVLPVASHRQRWRGYDYSARGFLQAEWVSDSVTDTEHDALVNHQITTTDLEQVGWPNGSGEKWNWERESGAGDLIAIERADNTSIKRWSHSNPSSGTTGARDAGHLLDTVNVDGASKGITHDGRGRVTDDGDFTYTYDPFDRLVSATPSGTSTATELYSYDARGRLVEVHGTTPSARREHVYDGAQIIASYVNGALDWEASWGIGIDHLLQWRHVSAPGGERTYIPLRDHRNNIVGLWDGEAVELVGLAEYSANGRATLFNQDESTTCEEIGTGNICAPLGGAFPFGFNTAWRSRTTGLSSMRHRWYSPVLGQFISHDPLEYIDSTNMYSFAGLDPIGQWDPWGLESTTSSKGYSSYTQDVLDEMKSIPRWEDDERGGKSSDYRKEKAAQLTELYNKRRDNTLTPKEKRYLNRRHRNTRRKLWFLALSISINILPARNLLNMLLQRVGPNQRALIRPQFYRRQSPVQKTENLIEEKILSKFKESGAKSGTEAEGVDDEAMKFQLAKGMGGHTLKGDYKIVEEKEKDGIINGIMTINYSANDPYDWHDEKSTKFKPFILYDADINGFLEKSGRQMEYSLQSEYTKTIEFQRNTKTGQVTFTKSHISSSYNSLSRTKIVDK